LSETLRLDMHVHTSFSHDGTEPPKRLVQRAAEIGLDGLAITDHNTQEGVAQALEAGEDEDIIVIPGVEVSCREGHVLLYGSECFPLGRGWTVGDLLAEVKRNFPTCIAAVAHPFDRFRSGMGWAAARYPFDAVETVNAHSPLPRDVVLPLARTLGVGEVGGSDAHFIEGLGKGRTLVRASEDLLHEIARSGRAEGGFDLWGNLVPRLKGRRRRTSAGQ